MAFRWLDSFSIDWAVVPPRMYVLVSGVVQATGGFLFIGGTGGWIDRVVNGLDYLFTNCYNQFRVLSYSAGKTVKWRFRSNGTNFGEFTIACDTGNWTIGNQAGTTTSGSLGGAVTNGTRFRCELKSGAITAFFDSTGGTNFTQIATASPAMDANGRCGIAMSGGAGGQVFLGEFDCGPIPLPLRKIPNGGDMPRTRLFALLSNANGAGGDETGDSADVLWASGWEALLTAAGSVDEFISRGYKRLWLRGPCGNNNGTGVFWGQSSIGTNFQANMMLSMRYADILLPIANSGFATGMTDGRLADNFMTALYPRLMALDEVMVYGAGPPSGFTGLAGGWRSSDLAQEEYVQEARQMGATFGFDVYSGLDPSQVNSANARRFLDYLYRTKKAGERVYGELHINNPDISELVIPPHLSSTFRVGPASGYMSSDTFFPDVLANPFTWWGPHRLPTYNTEHIHILDGGIAAGTRFTKALASLQAGYSVIIETGGLSVVQDKTLQNAAKGWNHSLRSGAKLMPTGI